MTSDAMPCGYRAPPKRAEVAQPDAVAIGKSLTAIGRRNMLARNHNVSLRVFSQPNKRARERDTRNTLILMINIRMATNKKTNVALDGIAKRMARTESGPPFTKTLWFAEKDSA